MRLHHALVLVALAPALGACATGATATLPTQWTYQTELKSPDVVAVTDNANHLVIGKEKQMEVVDAGNGQEEWSAPDKGLLGSIFNSDNISIKGEHGEENSYEAERWSYLLLGDQDEVVVMDYGAGSLLGAVKGDIEDQVWADRLDTGDELWKTTSLEYSLGRYELAADRTEGALRQLGALGDIAARVHDTNADRRVAEGRAAYTEDLVATVDGLDGFLFKTLDGLDLVDARTGDVIWTAPEVTGTGISRVLYDDGSGDLLVASHSPADPDAQVLARLDAATGQTRWASHYDSPAPAPSVVRSVRLQLVDGHVVLTGFGVEVFNADTGEKLWQSHTPEAMNDRLGDATAWGRITAAPVVVDGAVILTDSPTGFSCIDDCGAVIRSYDLDTGNVRWEAGPYSGIRRVGDAEIVDGIFVAALNGVEDVENSAVVALDRATGQERWKIASDDWRHALLSDLAYDGDAVYFVLGGTLRRVDPESGEVRARAAVADAGAGRPGATVLDRGSEVVVPTTLGAVAFSRSDLGVDWATVLPRMQPYAGPDGEDPAGHTVGRSFVRGDHLFLQHADDVLSVIDLMSGAALGHVPLPAGDHTVGSAPLGTLKRQGFMVTDDGRSLLVWDGGEAVTRYAVRASGG